MEPHTNNQITNDTMALRKLSLPFYVLTIITFIFNLILFFKNNNFYEKLLLGGGIITELSVLYSIFTENQENLSLLHQWFLVLGILGSIFFDKIYLTFIIYLFITGFATREITGYCFFESYEEKTANGTLTFFVIISIVLARIFLQKLYKNLLKF